jgi:hypothetical protein
MPQIGLLLYYEQRAMPGPGGTRRECRRYGAFADATLSSDEEQLLSQQCVRGGGARC